MSKIHVQVVEVSVRRDANTIPTIKVPAYEVAILRRNFGKENVNGEKPAGSIEVDPATEHDRLGAKYGPEKIKAIFGDDGGERLAELVLKAQVKVKAEKPAKTEQADTQTAA